MAGNIRDLEARIRRIKGLPTLPGVVKKLCTLVEDETTSASEIADIISTDQVLTARILKVVNSSFYGFPGRIGTINHALVLLGSTVIKGLVLSVAIIDAMNNSFIGLWEHSLGVAAASDVIARELGVPDPEEISTAGLLHDLGKVILTVEMTDLSQLVRREVNQSKIPIIEAEKKVLDGVTHCEIAGWLADEWNLPPCLREPILLHHQPTRAQVSIVPTAIVHLADVMVRALQFGSGGDPFVARIHPEALNILNLKMANLVGLLERIDEKLEGIDSSEFVG